MILFLNYTRIEYKGKKEEGKKEEGKKEEKKEEGKEEGKKKGDDTISPTLYKKLNEGWNVCMSGHNSRKS